jgi:hypothetical protein
MSNLIASAAQSSIIITILIEGGSLSHWVYTMTTSGRSFGKQKSQPVDPTRVPPGIDSSTFMSPAIPEEIKAAVPVLHALAAESYTPLLRRVNKFMLDGEMADAEFTQLQAKEFTDIDLSVVLSGLYTLVNRITKSKTKLSAIAEDLIKINMPGPFVELFIRLIRVSRNNFETLALNNNFKFPRLLKLRWRVDVTISSSSLSRILKPSIMLQVFIYISNISVMILFIRLY